MFFFFGIRRSKEVLCFLPSDVRILADRIELNVRKQKNDPNGTGMTCVIPTIQSMSQFCPCRMLKNWVAVWDAKWAPLSVADGPLFYVTGKKVCMPVSGDSWRKIWRKGKGGDVSTHSLRKGGAKFFRAQGYDDGTIQIQGGWASQSVMRQVYARATRAELHDNLLRCAKSHKG